jgi:hypothetical protein
VGMENNGSLEEIIVRGSIPFPFLFFKRVYFLQV